MVKYKILFILSFLLSLQASPQVISGKYYNYSGCKLDLLTDSSYFFSYHFDLSSSWSIGKWTISKDTLLLKNIPIYDTLIVTDTTWTLPAAKVFSVKRSEELVLSTDEKSGKISLTESIMNSISGGGQNRMLPPSKLIIKKGKLYQLNKNGRLDRKKVEDLFSKKKYKTYYKKEQQTST